jgi:hypothetical protein
MNFLNPLLAGLGAAFVALPIILHFLRRKRKPVMWGAMRFLVEAYRRKRRRMTLEQLLLLASRCLLVLLFAFAIGQPVFGGASTQSGPQELYIVLDDSIASAANDGSTESFEQHKAQAIELLSSLTPEAGDRAGLVLIGGPARSIISPASSDIAAVRRAVERLERTDAAADLEGALAIVGESIQTEEPSAPEATVAIISTLREGGVDPSRPLPRLDNRGRGVQIVSTAPAETPLLNFGIESVEPIRGVVLGEAQRDGQALVTVERSGVGTSEPASVEITLAVDDSGISRTAEAEFEPGQTTTEVMIGFTMPPANVSKQPTLTATLESDSNNADNSTTTAIDRRDVLRVGIVASRPLVGQVGLDRFSPADWVRLALAPGETAGELRIVDTTPSLIDAPRLATLDAVVLLEPDELAKENWSLLRRFVDRGGLLIVTPPADDSVQLWTDSMTEALGLDWTIAREPIEPPEGTLINVETRSRSSMLALIAGELEQLASSVSFQRLLPIETSQDGEASILELTDGSSLLVSAHPVTATGRESPGLVVYLAISPSLSWTDLPTRPLMVPLMQELVRQGVGLSSDRAVRVAGQTDALPSRAAEILTSEGESAALPIRNAGRYEMLDNAGDVVGVMAVRPDINGSRIGLTSSAELEPWFAESIGGVFNLQWLGGDTVSPDNTDASGSLRRADRSNLAFWLIVFAMAFAVVETLLARWSARSMTLHHQPEPQA